MMAEEITHLDRRFNDFEKVVDVKLSSIEKGVEEVRGAMAIFVQTMSSLHKEYVPRAELEAAERAQNKKIDSLEKEVKKLTAWRNYLAGGIAILAFLFGLAAESHFWVK